MNTSLAILDWLFRVGWQSAVLVLLVLLVQRLFRRRLSAGWRHALWLVVVVRLLLPVSFTSAFSLLNLVSPPLSQAGPLATVSAPPPSETALSLPLMPAGQGLEPPAAVDAPSDNQAERMPGSPLLTAPAGPTVPPAQPFDWVRFTFLFWLFGVFGFSVLAGWLVIRARRRLTGTIPVEDEPVLAVLQSCFRAMAIRSQPALAQTSGLSTPALCGFWRPRILLPAGFADRFSPRELRFVFLHELAHLKRGDLFLNWLMTALQIVHWWNPLIWLAFARMRADRELACDELALAVTGEGQRQAYGATILHLLESVRRPMAIPGLVGILEDKRRLKERLERIAGFRKPSRWSALAALLLGALAVVGLTDPQSTAPEDSTGDKTAPTPAAGASQAGVAHEAGDFSRAARDSSEGGRLWFTVTFDGKPVPDAELRFATADLSTFWGQLGAPGLTDQAGLSFIYPDVRADLLVVTSGNRSAEVRVADLTNGCEIALEPEAGVEGTLAIGGKPWANQHLKFQRRYEAYQRPPAGREPILVTTDAEGRFRIPAIIAGTVEIWLATAPLEKAERPPETPPASELSGYRELLQGLTSVRLRGGEVNHVDLRLAGRRITGRSTLERDPRPVTGFQAQVSLLGRDRESGVWVSGLSGADGSFLIPYAEPGSYDLCIELSEADGSMQPPIGGGTLPISISTNSVDGIEPLDVGVVRVQHRSGAARTPLLAGDRIGDFRAPTIDGHGLRLEDWIGQPLLLVLGYPSPFSSTRGELTQLHDWYRAREPAARPEVIAAFAGWQTEGDLKWVREQAFPWPILDASKLRRAFEERYTATWRPDFILIDSQGRMVARDYRFDEIRPGIERLMTEFAAANAGKEAHVACQESIDFDIFWPPHNPSLPDQRRRRPILNGAIKTRVVVPSEEPAFAEVSVTLTRPRDEMSREFWNNRLAFPEHEWMSQVRVWDANKRWLWPNLPYLLRLPGQERVERYGGVDPGKGVDNDFAAVLIRSYDAEGNETSVTCETPFVSAEWHPGDVRGAVDGHTVVQVARSDEFRIPVGDGRRGSAGKLEVWLIYADFMGFDPPSSWPKEPEYAGGALAWFEIEWRREADGTWHMRTRSAAPPGNTGFDWARWVAGVKIP